MAMERELDKYEEELIREKQKYNDEVEREERQRDKEYERKMEKAEEVIKDKRSEYNLPDEKVSKGKVLNKSKSKGKLKTGN